MLHVYVGSSKPDLISQRNTQMTNKATSYRDIKHTVSLNMSLGCLCNNQAPVVQRAKAFGAIGRTLRGSALVLV